MTQSKTSSKEEATITEQFFAQVSESIQMIFDLTSRTDERVKMLIEKQKDIENNLDDIKEDVQRLNKKVAIILNSDPKLKLMELQDKVHNLEVRNESIIFRLGHHDNRWTKIFDIIWKIAPMIIAGYILYRLGISAPPS